MAKASASSKSAEPRRLPRGRHALAPEDVLSDQRERLLAAVPAVAAERGYEAMSVADIVKAAAVSRNAFYKNFRDKQDCVATAHELGHERLFDVLSSSCYEGAMIEERVGASLKAALDVLADDPALARFLFVEAPSGGDEIALRYHEWLGRYGTLLRSAAPDLPAVSLPEPEVEQVIVGGIASRVASEVLRGRGAKLRELADPFLEYVLAFYRLGEPGPREGQVLAFESDQDDAAGSYEARRKQAGA
ncbi:MAG TPA: helix-turn-helix domain-containing protein [Solirubrobacterales bacterium]|jgi:AcrR family transcriptional regulator|nr:helix-turn-helix domain-containing protein [Solirubrobacterales bacterium]